MPRMTGIGLSNLAMWEIINPGMKKGKCVMQDPASVATNRQGGQIHG